MGRDRREITQNRATYKLASTQGYQTMDTPDGDASAGARRAASRSTAKSRSSRRKRSRRMS